MLRRSNPKPKGSKIGATERDLVAAYRLLLGRDPDPSGYTHYRHLLQGGMSLEELLKAFIDSDEYREREMREASVHNDPAAPPVPKDQDVITPADVIRRYSIEELSETADEYYRRVTDPSPPKMWMPSSASASSTTLRMISGSGMRWTPRMKPWLPGASTSPTSSERIRFSSARNGGSIRGFCQSPAGSAGDAARLRPAMRPVRR